MTVARGRPRKMLEMVGEVQSLVSIAKAHYENDRRDRAHTVQSSLEEAFELCVKITSLYEPLPESGLTTTASDTASAPAEKGVEKQ